MFDQLVIIFFQGLERRKRLQPSCLKDEVCHGRGWSHQQIDKEDFPESERSSMKIRNRTGPEHCFGGTAALIWRGDDRIPLSATRWLGE